jgi:hypothetical protein
MPPSKLLARPLRPLLAAAVLSLAVPARAEDFRALVARLADDDPAVRDSAEAEIARLGFRAERAIHAHLCAGSPDAETRARLRAAADRLALRRLGASSLQLEESFAVPGERASGAAWSADGATLAVAGREIALRGPDGRWTVLTGEAIAVSGAGSGSDVLFLARNGMRRAGAAAEGAGEELVACECGDFAKLAVSSEGRIAAFLGEGQLLFRNGDRSFVSPRWECWVLDLAWLPGGRLAAACAAAGRPDRAQGIGVLTADGEWTAWRETDRRPRAVAWDAAGEGVVWSDLDSLHVADPCLLDDRLSRDAGARWIRCLDGVALTALEREITIWKLPDWTPACTRVVGTGDIEALALDPEGSRLAVLSEGGAQIYRLRFRLTSEIPELPGDR